MLADADFDPRALRARFADAGVRDPDAALVAMAELAETRSAWHMQWAARAVLTAIRDDARLLGAWIDAIPQPGTPAAEPGNIDPETIRRSAARLQGEGIAALARLDPEAALERWLKVAENAADAALDDTIAEWARHDAAGTLRAMAAAQSDEHVRDRLLAEWAKVSPSAALSYAAAIDGFGGDTPEAQARAFTVLAVTAFRDGAARIDEILAVASQLPAEAADRVRGIALRELAKNDPNAAAARLAELGEAGREIVAYEIAERYAEREPFSALAWAREQGLPEAELAIVRTTVPADPYRALDLALLASEPVRAEAIITAFSGSVNRNPALAQDLVRRLHELTLGSDRYGPALAEVVATWHRRRPDEAVEWARANAFFLDRLPPDERAKWAERVARGAAD